MGVFSEKQQGHKSKSNNRSKRLDAVQTLPSSFNSMGIFSPVQPKAVCPCDGFCPRCHPGIQAKLAIGSPNDIYEQEADRVADEVMRLSDPIVRPESSDGLPQVAPRPILVEKAIQTKQDNGAQPALGDATESGVDLLRGGGRPMSAAERSYYEPRFGADFSWVRIHDNARAAELTRSIRARAFTLGPDVVFGAGEYSFSETSGRRLFAHELTHVLQQDRTSEKPTTIRCGFWEDLRDRSIALPSTFWRRVERAWGDMGSGDIVHFWCDFNYTLLAEEVSAFEEAVGRRTVSPGRGSGIFAAITERRSGFRSEGQQGTMAHGVVSDERPITNQDWEIAGATLDTAKCRIWHDRSRVSNFSGIGPIYQYYTDQNRYWWNLDNINQARRCYIDAMIREIPSLLMGVIGPTPLQAELARLALAIFLERDHPGNLCYLLPNHPIAGQSTNQWIRSRLQHTRIPPGPIEQIVGQRSPDFIMGSGW